MAETEIVFHALLAADKAFYERETDKSAAAGVFSNFNFPTFPAMCPPWFVYAAFENVEGKHDVVFTQSTADTQAVAFSIAGQVDVTDRGQPVELVVPVAPFPFASAGEYFLSMIIDGKEVHSRVIHVNQIGGTK